MKIIEGSSDRVFGLVMSVFFAVVALMPLSSGLSVRWWAMLIAGGFLFAALLFPIRLALLNRYWMRLGLLMSSILSPVAMGIVFFGVVTPFALSMKAFRKHFVPLHFEKEIASYWIPRNPPGPHSKSMKNLF